MHACLVWWVYTSSSVQSVRHRSRSVAASRSRSDASDSARQLNKPPPRRASDCTDDDDADSVSDDRGLPLRQRDDIYARPVDDRRLYDYNVRIPASFVVHGEKYRYIDGYIGGEFTIF